MSNTLALVLAGGQVNELLCLTERRAKSALPIFGIYRIIDLVLSNLMHSGIEKVGVLSQYRPHDLVSHIDSGEHWDYSGREREIRILPPYRGLHHADWYKGTADAVFQNLTYIEECGAEHVLIASADHVYRMDYRPLIHFHLEHNADATICFTMQQTRSKRFGYGIIEDDRLVDYVEKPEDPPSNMISMTLYVFRKDFLVDMLTDNAQETSHEFGKDIIPRLVGNPKVFAFQHHGYWAYGRTIDSYFRTSMDLLKGKIDINKWQIRTNLLERSAKRDRLPALINGPVKNSVISDECVIEGSVSDSILSPGVKVAQGAIVHDCIIFHDVLIRERSRLNKVICDKDVVIGSNVTIGAEGEQIASREFKELLRSGISVLGRRVHIPDDITIGANTVIYPGAHIHGPSIQAGSTLR